MRSRCEAPRQQSRGRDGSTFQGRLQRLRAAPARRRPAATVAAELGGAQRGKPRPQLLVAP
eukprot:6198184-Pleurochrysis_carterae.AAC.1